MIKRVLYTGLSGIIFLLLHDPVFAQDVPQKTDTFFLAKKKGLLGKLGRSISTNPVDDPPMKLVNPFLKYKGKPIRSIETVSLGFEYNIDDTNQVKNNLPVRVGKIFHKNSTNKVIKRNLFFKEGDPVFPFLLADNERYLRELIYFQDARILVEYAEGSTDSVDVVVVTKDVFSIGGKLLINSIEDGRAEISEENFLGSGTRLAVGGYYEKHRFPQKAISGELIRRNIGGSFIDWTSGYRDYGPAFTSGRRQETAIYTSIEKPLVTPYIPSTGALQWGYYRTRNTYDTDSFYRDSIKYAYYNIDGWFGYSLDSKRSLYSNREIKVHRFVALRLFKQSFISLPKKVFDYRFSDLTGALASFNIFRQVFYKANFIYGFGRSEDIPEGFSFAITGGYVKKQEAKRPYSGIELSIGEVRKKGYYSNYTFRAGGYYYRNRFEDIDLLANLEYFSRLRKMSSTWYQRSFITTGITAQVNPVLNTPLFLNNDYGLPYFDNGTLSSDLRATVRAETVFYNKTKVWGFRFAPFVFADVSLLKPRKMGLPKADIYSAIGGGVRSRNENLVFGTIELKAYYFPRTNGNMPVWQIDLNSSIRFKYKSVFIRRPDFVISN